MNIGQRFSDALYKKDIKSKDLVDKFNISQQYVSNIKKAKKINDTIANIASEYDININWLMTGEGKMFVQKITHPSNLIQPLDVNIQIKNINIKLFQFPRRSLVYFYYLMINENINNSIDYFAWMEKKEKTNIIINFISDFIIEGNKLSLSAYRAETDEFISLFITNDELDYIFKNKVTFVKPVKSMIDVK